MIPRDKLQKEERRNFSALFSSIYYAFGEDGNSTSDARELAAGYRNKKCTRVTHFDF